MLDEYRLKAMTIGDYIDDVYERKIKSDQAVQRAFCWSNEAINNLVYSTLSKKRIYIPNTWFVGIDKRDKHAYMFNYSDLNTILFAERKDALDKVKAAEKNKIKISEETDYEEY